jgi:repressor LexA
MPGRGEERQQKILEYIRSFIDEHDFPPSIRQIQQGCAVSSTSVVDYNLDRLEEKGFIRRVPDSARGIELLAAGGGRPRVVTVPVYGTIAAGTRLTTPADSRDYEETIEIAPETLRGRGDVFAVRVKGDSMIDAMVADGDIVILQSTPTADDGEIVAAWLREEELTTLKRLHREGDRVRLQPRNPTMEPIYTTADNVEIQGRFIAAISSPS